MSKRTCAITCLARGSQINSTHTHPPPSSSSVSAASRAASHWLRVARASTYRSCGAPLREAARQIRARAALVHAVHRAVGQLQRPAHERHVHALALGAERRVEKHRVEARRARRRRRRRRAEVAHHVGAQQVHARAQLHVGDVLARDGQRVGVDVHAQHAAGAQQRGADGQHARAAAEVAHVLAVNVVERLVDRVQQLRRDVRRRAVLLQLGACCLERTHLAQRLLQVAQPHRAPLSHIGVRFASPRAFAPFCVRRMRTCACCTRRAGRRIAPN
ncbi:hypothetical protein FGB62_59g022 [Gracilaria domingensis]|nr:hypothetical protein FGB62_59g022 [Gracilaria domingensis]